MNLTVKPFDELTVDELYAIMQQRCAVFVVEQKILYQDFDGYDQKALHVMGWQDGKLVAYARVFAPGVKYPDAAIGRFLTAAEMRGKGAGHRLIRGCLDEIRQRFPAAQVTISAQAYLEKFYASHGFLRRGDTYIEEEIPHIRMQHLMEAA